MTAGTSEVPTQVIAPTPPFIDETRGPVRDQKVAELEAEIAQLKSTVAASKQEIELRDKRILELENEIREIEKELPKVRRPRGPPEKWKTGIFDCFADTEICMLGTFAPCVLFGQNAMTVIDWDDKIVGAPTAKGCCGAVQTVGEGTKDGFRFFSNCLIHCVLGGAVQIVTCLFLGPAAAAVTLAPLVAYEYRTKIRTKYNLVETPMADCQTSCFCHPCALCQEARELQIRGHGGLRKDLELKAHANEADRAAFEERVRAEEREKVLKEMGATPAPLKPEGKAPIKK